MYLRRCLRKKSGRDHIYWELVECYRTERGPRQRIVSYLGDMSKPAREGFQVAIEDRGWWTRLQLFDEDLVPEWVEIDTQRVTTERARDFGGAWVVLQVLDILGIVDLFWRIMPPGRQDVPWRVMLQVLVACRLCSPSSELRIANCVYERTALEDLLGLPADKVNDDRLYRALDALLPHKSALETHLKNRMGELFDLEYDLLLYDITSTFIEGTGKDNKQMKRGYSRDKRPDCKQVCIALVVTRDGMPLGYEVFDGNRADVTTVKEIVVLMEKRYGKANRVWVMDRGMMSEANLAFLKQEDRRYIIGASRASLKRFEKELRDENWTTIREGLEVRLRPSEDGTEVFVLCRSKDRRLKEEAMLAKFEKQIQEGLTKIAASCAAKPQNRSAIERRIGALRCQNSRAWRLFKVTTMDRENGGCAVAWEKVEAHRTWCDLTAGCYLLRSNIADWSAQDLWQAYIQLTEAEEAFRIQKSDLQIRPVWHQKMERVQAHIFICFLAYVVWKTFGQLCKRGGLGDEPRQVFDELSQIKMVDVVMQTKDGRQIRRRSITEPTKPQKVLLTMLNLRLPKQLRMAKM